METKCWYCFCSFNVSSFNVRSQEAQGKGLIKIQREKKTIIKLHLVQGCQFWHFWCDKTAGQEVNQTQITHPPPPTSQTTPNSTCSIVSFTRWNVCEKSSPEDVFSEFFPHLKLSYSSGIHQRAFPRWESCVHLGGWHNRWNYLWLLIGIFLFYS